MQAQIKAILDVDESDDDCESRCEQIEALISETTWPVIQDTLIGILSDDQESYENWHACLQVFWGAVLDQRPVEGKRVIALAYHRLNTDLDEDENFAWSLVCKIKGVDYLSRYDPLDDPEIVRIINEFI